MLLAQADTGTGMVRRHDDEHVPVCVTVCDSCECAPSNGADLALQGLTWAVSPQDGFAQLGPLQGESLRARIRIQFVDGFGAEEAGVDGGGLFKDFLECLVRLEWRPVLSGATPRVVPCFWHDWGGGGGGCA